MNLRMVNLGQTLKSFGDDGKSPSMSDFGVDGDRPRQADRALLAGSPCQLPLPLALHLPFFPAAQSSRASMFSTVRKWVDCGWSLSLGAVLPREVFR